MESNPKVFDIEACVEYPFVGVDDVFQISLPLYEKEIQDVVEKTKSITWVDNDLQGSELLEFSQSAYQRAVEIAEKVAVSIWGEKMLTQNGARYGFFLPDEINEAIYESPDYIEEKNLRHHRQETSRLRFREDAKILKDENNKGRWYDRLIPEPLWDNQRIYGAWHSSSGNLASFYGLRADLLVESEKVRTSYEIRYRRDDVEIWIDVYSYNKSVEQLLNDFIVGKGKLQGHSDFKTRIIDYPPTRSIRLMVIGISQQADLNMYMSLLDELVNMRE